MIYVNRQLMTERGDYGCPEHRYVQAAMLTLTPAFSSN